MEKISFGSGSTGGIDAAPTECDRQLREAILKIVESATAAGWRPEDVLLSVVEISWEMYEEHRSSRP
jgi:hypothetical protein